MSKVAITIEYAGMQLQIAKNASGEEITPLKPISDLFNLDWRSQHKKITESEYLSKYLGVCIGDIPHAGGQNREQICILLSRVSAFLMSISPDKVKASGNESGAEFLIEKLNEWADALHDYETIGVAVNKNQHSAAKLQLDRINTFARLIMVKNKSPLSHDRKAIESAQASIAKEIGIPFQADLLNNQ